MASVPSYSPDCQIYCDLVYDRQPGLHVCLFNHARVGKSIYVNQYGFWVLVYFDKTVLSAKKIVSRENILFRRPQPAELNTSEIDRQLNLLCGQK